MWFLLQRSVRVEERRDRAEDWGVRIEIRYKNYVGKSGKFPNEGRNGNDHSPLVEQQINKKIVMDDETAV